MVSRRDTVMVRLLYACCKALASRGMGGVFLDGLKANENGVETLGEKENVSLCPSWLTLLNQDSVSGPSIERSGVAFEPACEMMRICKLNKNFRNKMRHLAFSRTDSVNTPIHDAWAFDAIPGLPVSK